VSIWRTLSLNFSARRHGAALRRCAAGRSKPHQGKTYRKFCRRGWAWFRHGGSPVHSSGNFMFQRQSSGAGIGEHADALLARQM